MSVCDQLLFVRVLRLLSFLQSIPFSCQGYTHSLYVIHHKGLQSQIKSGMLLWLMMDT